MKPTIKATIISFLIGLVLVLIILYISQILISAIIITPSLSFLGKNIIIRFHETIDEVFSIAEILIFIVPILSSVVGFKLSKEYMINDKIVINDLLDIVKKVAVFTLLPLFFYFILILMSAPFTSINVPINYSCSISSGLLSSLYDNIFSCLLYPGLLPVIFTIFVYVILLGDIIEDNS